MKNNWYRILSFIRFVYNPILIRWFTYPLIIFYGFWIGIRSIWRIICISILPSINVGPRDWRIKITTGATMIIIFHFFSVNWQIKRKISSRIKNNPHHHVQPSLHFCILKYKISKNSNSLENNEIRDVYCNHEIFYDYIR